MSDTQRISEHANGFADEGFGAVVDAFEANFTERGELGAAFSLYVDGKCAVDLHGGVADKASGRPWTDDTLQLVFSTTKGIASTCIAKLVDEGKLRYDQPVSDIWPELRAAKDGLRVDELLSHQGGLIAYDTPLTFDQVMDIAQVVAALEAQEPLWTPGEAHGYHAITFGYLAGELVRRVDGRSLGRYLADEIAGPLDLEFYVGLPESEEPRVSTLELAPPPSDPDELKMMAAVLGPGTNGYRALSLDGVIRMAPENHFNSRALHATEMPAANGITNARSLAKLYAATCGEVDGVRLFGADTLDAARTERVNGPDKSLIKDSRFGAGFWLHDAGTPMIQDGSYGHPGAGGSLGFANPELGIGYGYVMNQMGGGLTGDPRANALNDAVRASL